MKKIIPFLLILAGCGKFPDGQSIWAEGLWLLPWATFLASVFFGYKAYKQSKGSVLIEDGEVTNKPGGKMPIYQLSYFWYCVGFLAVTIGILIAVNADK